MDMHNWQAEMHANEKKYRQLVQQLNSIVAQFETAQDDPNTCMARVAYEVSMHQRILNKTMDTE